MPLHLDANPIASGVKLAIDLSIYHAGFHNTVNVCMVFTGRFYYSIPVVYCIYLYLF